MPPMVTLLFGEHSVTPHGTWDTLGFSKPHLTASEEVTQTPFNLLPATLHLCLGFSKNYA